MPMVYRALWGKLCLLFHSQVAGEEGRGCHPGAEPFSKEAMSLWQASTGVGSWQDLWKPGGAHLEWVPARINDHVDSHQGLPDPKRPHSITRALGSTRSRRVTVLPRLLSSSLAFPQSPGFPEFPWCHSA